MAQRVITQLVSDLSGDEVIDGDGETIEFAYRGARYSIDLTGQEAQAFDAAITTYIEHASKIASGRGGRRATGTSAGPKASDIRAWAQKAGLDVPSRGRIPQEIKEQYEAAN